MTETRGEYKTCQTCGQAGADGYCVNRRLSYCLNFDKWVPMQNPMDNTTVQELRNQIAKLIFEKEQLKDELAALKEAQSSVCHWTLEELYEGDGIWNTDCGTTAAFEEGTPEENDVKFCSYCGKKMVQVIPPKEEDQEAK